MKLRNKGSDAVSMYRPVGDPGALTVEPGQEFEVPGTQVTEGAPDDAILVEHDGELRAYSTTRWEPVDVTTTKVPDPVTAKDEG